MMFWPRHPGVITNNVAETIADSSRSTKGAVFGSTGAKFGPSLSRREASL